MKNQLYAVEVAKKEIKHKEPVVVGSCDLQYAKLRKWELDYSYFDNFFDIENFEELEVDKDCLYLALAEKELTHCIRHEKK